MHGGDSQPSCGDCFSPISRLARAATNKISDMPSSFAASEKSVRCLGKNSGATIDAISPGMTLMRNSQCQV